MEAKHTPGPWASPAVLGNVQKYLICRKDDKSGSIFPFATLTAKHGKYKVDWDEMQANARLIAAAPELLEQLIDYRNTDSRHDHKDDCDCETCLLISRIQAYQGIQEIGNRND